MPPTEGVTELPRHRPEPTGHERALSEGGARWRPTRAGIINVWRYYDETLEFHAGRLLLRGPNGTGKSKALELLLPFLFDANLQPSRLSTFGGTERTMHWNLMGEGHSGTNRVGYVWLEFGRPDAPSGGDDADGAPAGGWFTCGARLQASTNTRNVAVTYFTTDQRVGENHELPLINGAGRPLTRQDLAAAIGERGRVYETATDYRNAVRQTLFPGFTQQRYDALITALLQLRTPKLSEHLDPAVLSTLLSRALPPLDQADIAEIAEGFERLDRQSRELQHLNAEVDAADTLAARQRTYARRVLRAAAAALVSATSHMDQLTRTARESQEEYENTESQLEGLTERDTTLATQRGQCSTRIETLTNLDAYREGRDLDRLRSERDTALRKADDARAHATMLAERAEEDGRKAADAQERATRAGQYSEECHQEAQRAARVPGADATFEELEATEEQELALQLLQGAVDSRESQVTEVRRVLGEHERALGERTAAERHLEEARADLETAEEAVTGRQREYDEARDVLAGQLDAWVHECVELGIDADAVVARADDPVAILTVVNEAHGRATNEIAHTRAREQSHRDALTTERERVTSQRDQLHQQIDVPPPAPHTRHLDRSTLTGAPLWRLVAFRDGVDTATQAGVEAALEAAGLLDAWVFPDGRMAMPDNDAFAEPDRAAPVTGASLAEVLECEPEAPVDHQRVARLLARVAYGPNAPDQVAAVGADGSWRLSATQGRATKPEPAYIGATARQRAREQRIAELDEQIADLDSQIEAVDETLHQLSQRHEALAEEVARRPDQSAVERASSALRKAEAEQAARSDAVTRAGTAVSEREAEVTATSHALTVTASERGLPTSAEALTRVADALAAFRSRAETWLAARNDAAMARTHADEWAQAAQRAHSDAQEAADSAGGQEGEAARLAERVDTVETSIGAEYREVLEEVTQLRQQLERIDREREELRSHEGTLKTQLGTLQNERDTAARQRDDATTARDAAAARFRHLWGSWLPSDARLDLDVDPPESTRAALETARRVAESLTKTPHDTKDLRAAEARVSDQLRDTEEALAGRADLSLDTDEDVRLLTASVDGRRLGIAEFADLIRAERDQARTHLTDSERELFDRTLTGDTRRQLAARIRQAQELVDTMNQHLEQVRTASRVRVHLRWQVNPALPSGTREARDLLLRDPAGLEDQERDALHQFFRERIEEAREDDTAASWEYQLLAVLDYTKWHQFVVDLDRDDGQGWRPVTKRVHGALSGGEKAIVLHLPLFAAAAAHYRSTPHAPRLILLDEVFVGVDAMNRGQLLELLATFDLDLVLTSDHEWCTYAELDGIAVHQLLAGTDDDAVTTVRFTWDGRQLTAADEPGGAGEHAG